MLKYFSILVIVFLCACKIPKSNIETNVFSSNLSALWITDDSELPESDSLYYLDRSAPLFRKEFKGSGEIDSARLFISAAGYYKAYFNGKPVGENILDPAWTDYSKRIYYSDYDVTSLIREGQNCMGVTLGNGFYNPLPLRKWGRRNMREDTSVGKPTFIAKLILTYTDGTSAEIVSDSSWKFSTGPLLKNSVYLGVTYDARKELGAWKTVGFDDYNFSPIRIGEGPGGKLQKAVAPPVQVVRIIKPVSISAAGRGGYVVDMGENFTGTYRIKLQGNNGDTIRFRFGERVYKNGDLNPMTTVIGQIKKKGAGGPGAPEIAWQEDNYIFGNNETAWFSPDFTYHTYRYMEITGLGKKPGLEEIEGLIVHSIVTNNNHFSSSSELLNNIQKATERTFLANLVSVQSDCPAREKFGYGGDLNATSESFIYNFDMQSFYRKTVYDWVDAMNDSCFVDTAPYVGIKYCGISWESAFLTTQYYLYLYYNDIEFIQELYDLNLQWMKKVERLHPEGMVNSGLSDHESLEPVPVQLTGTCHYLQCVRIMQEFALLMNDSVNLDKFGKLEDRIKSLLVAKYWEASISEPINRQTLYSTLLYHKVLPDNQIPAAVDSLQKAIENGPSSHFNTGIFGTKYALETLSKYVDPQAVFDIVNSTDYPGWGFMIKQGATTIWETWKESDNVYSNCHPMFGTVTEWYYRWLGGIQANPDFPGFKEFVLRASTPEGLMGVNCTYHSPFGAIISNWEKLANGGCRFEFSIPQGTKAQVILPLKQAQSVSIRKDMKDKWSLKNKTLQSGKFKLESGNYIVVIQ